MHNPVRIPVRSSIMNTNIPPPTLLVRAIRESWWLPIEVQMRTNPNLSECEVRTQTFEPLSAELFDNLQPPFHQMADRIRNSGPQITNTWTYKIVRERGILYRVTLLNGQLREKTVVQDSP